MDLDLIHALVLGVVQGATEFLPVSSSAHLLILPTLLHWPNASLTFDVVVHLATALAVILYFRADWWALVKGTWTALRTTGRPWSTREGRLFTFLVCASAPAAYAGLAWQDAFEAALGGTQGTLARSTAWQLMATGALLLVAEWLGRRRGRDADGRGSRDSRDVQGGHRSGDTDHIDAPSRVRSGDAEGLKFWQAMAIGVAQAIAIIPGISRSGATIAAGLGVGLRREEATRFSFLLAAPIILGAGGVKAVQFVQVAHAPGEVAVLMLGFVASFLVGYWSIGWLLGFVRRASLVGFAAYCFAFSLLALWLLRDLP